MIATNLRLLRKAFAAVGAVLVSLVGLAQPGLAAPSAAVSHNATGASGRMIMIIIASQQVARITDGSGANVGPGTFEASLQSYWDGTAKGDATVSVSGERFSFQFTKIQVEYRADGEPAYVVRGRGERSAESGATRRFTFIARIRIVEGAGTSPDCVIWDITGNEVTDAARFAFEFMAEGQVRSSW